MEYRELIKIDTNGSKHFRQLVTCDRCGGKGIYYIGTLNGRLLPAHPDSGICYKCNGSGKVWEKVIERTPEYQAKLDARRKARQEKRSAAIKAAEEAHKAERERIKAEEAAREAAEDAKKAKSQYVGSIGEKITFDAVLEEYFSFKVPGAFGNPETRCCFKFRDDDGNALTWMTSCSRDLESGDRVTVTATVKKHEEYKDEKTTYLNRCKIERR